MELLSKLMRWLAGIGVTAFFAGLVLLLIVRLSQNPHVIQTALNGISEMLNSLFTISGR